jgi:glucosamine-6-phosphate deaminase
MRVRVFSSPRRAARSLAAEIRDAVRRTPALVLGLPTGRTPVHLYDALAAMYARGEVDFSRARTFNLDEFVGLESGHPGSFRAFLRRHLFARVNIPAHQAYFLNGAARDLERECARFERAIHRAGGIDLLVLGLGRNGHVGFNEPGPALVARTHRTRLLADTRQANAALFGGRARQVPREAVTIGIGTILDARRIVVMATGRSKAGVVRRLLRSPVTPRLPASFLHLHRNVDVVLDREAAGELPPSSSRSR